MYKVIYQKGNELRETIVSGQYTRDQTVKALVANGAKIVRAVRVA
jgi:hypothetical protein